MRYRIFCQLDRAVPFIFLAVVWLVCAAYLMWVFWPLGWWLHYPLVYNGDGLWNLFVIKTVLETGWYGSNSHLGAPFSATFLDFSKPESLYLLMFRLAASVTDNVALIHNLFYFSGFFLVAGSALLVLRSGFHLSWMLAAAGALLYAFLPFHFMRQGHLFLSNYFTVPLGVWMALLVSSDRPPFFETGRMGTAKWTIWLAAAIVASTSIYYAFFALYLIAVVGCFESIRTILWRHFLSAVLVCVLIAVFVVSNLVPTLLYQAEYGMNGQVASRTLGESEMYSLRPIQLLLPIKEHPFPALAELTRKYETGAPFVNENRSSYLGLFGCIGFLFLLTALVAGHPIILKVPPFGIAARINILALSLSIAGGGGMIAGLLLSPQFRALNRISVLIAFVSIAGLLLLLDRLALLLPVRSRGIFLLAISVLAVAVGLWDQTPLNARPDVEKLVAEYDSDHIFVQSIESRLPNGGLVLQWPYTPFPEVGSYFKETPYSHLRGYLHGKNLHWSYGGMKGRKSDLWHMSLNQFPLTTQLSIAQSSGFVGIWLDRRALHDGGLQLEGELHSLGVVGAQESPDKMLVFYPLARSGNSPPDLLPQPMLGAGFYQWEGSIKDRWAWTSGDASLTLLNTSDKPRQIQLSFTLSSLIDRSVKIMLEKQTLKTFRLYRNNYESIELKLSLSPGKSEIFLTSAQPPVIPNSTDQRQLAVAVGSLRLSPIE